MSEERVGQGLQNDIAKIVSLNLHKTDAIPVESDVDNPTELRMPSVQELNLKISQPGKLTIDTPVLDKNWSEHLSGKVAWMLSNNQQQMKINVHPAELGPIEVKISMQNDQTNINFVSNNSVTREAIEEAFPRLRDMLDETGLNLSHSSVSDQSNQKHQEEYKLMNTMESGSEGVETGEVSTALYERRSRGLIDHFI